METPNKYACHQAVPLVHELAQPEPFLSLKMAKHPTHSAKGAHVKLKSGRV
jgi:hypothetical protein